MTRPTNSINCDLKCPYHSFEDTRRNRKDTPVRITSNSESPSCSAVGMTTRSPSPPLQEQPSTLAVLGASRSMQRMPETSSTVDVAIPLLLREGVQMTKVSPGKQKSYRFQLDPNQGQIIWQSKKLRISTYATLCDSPSAMFMSCIICSSYREHQRTSLFV